MSEFENIPEKIEEVAQEEIAQAEEAAEVIEEAVEVVSEEAEAVAAPAEPLVPTLEPAADAAVNFMKETDAFATDYLKETMPGAIPEEPAPEPIQPAAAMPEAQVSAPVWQNAEQNQLPPENADFGSKPFATENFAPQPIEAAPETVQPQPVTPQQQFQQYQQQQRLCRFQYNLRSRQGPQR